MSKVKMKIMTCPACGRTMKTQLGENDIMGHIMLNAKPSSRNEEHRAGELVKLIKTHKRQKH